MRPSFFAVVFSACMLPLFAFDFALPGAQAADGGKSFGSGKTACTKTVWKIDQRHHSSGNLTLYFTDDALKIDKTNFGYFIVCKAPDWKVYCFRNDDKVMCKLSREAYLAEQGYLVNGPSLESFPKVKDEFIGTMKTSVYRGISHDDWLAKFPGVPSQIYDVIMASAFYHAEPAKGVVLKSLKHPTGRSRKKAPLLSLDAENVSGIRLETLKISKTPYKPSDFSIPANYRPAKLRIVVTSVENRREADSIIEQMGLGEKLGK